LASTLLILAAPVNPQFNPPILNVSTAAVTPAVVNSSTPMPVAKAPTYASTVTTVIDTRKNVRNWLLMVPSGGTTISPGILQVTTATPAPATTSVQMFLYLPNDDGFWPALDVSWDPTINQRRLLLLAAAGNTNVMLPQSVLPVTTAILTPTIVNTSQVTVTMPAPFSVTTAALAPTTTVNFSVTIVPPVIQAFTTLYAPSLPTFFPATIPVSTQVLAPSVSAGPDTIWAHIFKLVNLGLFVTPTVEWVHSATVPYGYLVAENPPAGTIVQPNSTVFLYASLGPEPPAGMATYVSVVGIQSYLATSALTAAGFTFNTTPYVYSPVVPAGYVVSESLIPGNVYALGTAVTLTLSLGPTPPTPGGIVLP
jgi:hypothetical protein